MNRQRKENPGSFPHRKTGAAKPKEKSGAVAGVFGFYRCGVWQDGFTWISGGGGGGASWLPSLLSKLGSSSRRGMAVCSGQTWQNTVSAVCWRTLSLPAFIGRWVRLPPPGATAGSRAGLRRRWSQGRGPRQLLPPGGTAGSRAGLRRRGRPRPGAAPASAAEGAMAGGQQVNGPNRAPPPANRARPQRIELHADAIAFNHPRRLPWRRARAGTGTLGTPGHRAGTALWRWPSAYLGCGVGTACWHDAARLGCRAD
ncbi:hypothetical protein SEVIR_3G347251v4 [Setaria viridis]